MAKYSYQSAKAGEWVLTSYGSGTLTIKRNGAADGEPWYAITYTCRDPDNEAYRRELASGLADWLNGDAPRPEFLNGSTHWDADTAALSTGHCIEARGPKDESSPGRGDWETRHDLQSITARAAMIARLFE